MSSDDQNAPSMLGGHAQYAKGYVSETIGNMTGSDAWKESGKQDSQAGIEQMKAARDQRPTEPAASGLGGRMEELAGRATGCEGMEKDGQIKQDKMN